LKYLKYVEMAKKGMGSGRSSVRSMNYPLHKSAHVLTSYNKTLDTHGGLEWTNLTSPLTVFLFAKHKRSGNTGGK
jgi:hypothetical protein